MTKNEEVINYIKKYKNIDEELLTKNGRNCHIISKDLVNKYLSYWDIAIEALENQTSVIAEIEKIKAEIDKKGWYNKDDKEQSIKIIDNHISELKEECGMRQTNYGMLTSNPLPNINEQALDYIRKVKLELDGTDILNSGIPLNNEFFCDLFAELFEEYSPTIPDIAEFIKKVKEDN